MGLTEHGTHWGEWRGPQPDKPRKRHGRSRLAVDSPLMTLVEVALLLRIHRNTIYRLIRTGKVEGALRVGNDWRIEKRAIAKLVNGS